MVISYLSRRYISISSHEGLKTGNKYQSVRLGNELVEGMRDHRDSLFSVFDFRGRSVLDCGCNIGEMSRQARARGAYLVDGYEYDDYFVHMARLINVANGTARVSFYQKDITNPAAFEDTFDVGLAFSVFPYIQPVLKELSEHIREALILETHDVKPNLHAIYIDALRPYFPFHSFITAIRPVLMPADDEKR
jgi:SAM-dependent methyltransferase